MSGAVTFLGDNVCEGWASIDERAGFAATIHLVLGERIVSSTIADEQVHVSDGGDGPSYGRFRLAIQGLGPAELADAYVLVGETGEAFDLVSGKTKWFQTDAASHCFVSHRDAIARGLSRQDIISGLYLDILGRPADPAGLAHALHHYPTCLDLDRLRRVLVESNEYDQRPKSIDDAAGRLFGDDLLLRTSRRVVDFDHAVDFFLASTASFQEKIFRFFPALACKPEQFARLQADVADGLPERESFFRALAVIADSPGLIIDPHFFEVADMSRRLARHDDEAANAVPCSSPLFASGWHALEPNKAGRWMTQIGIVLNPAPQQLLDRVSATVEGEYGPVGTVWAFSESAALVAAFVDRGRDKTLMISSVGGGSFLADYVLILAEHATTPWCLSNAADDRRLSLNISSVNFEAAGKGL